MKIIIEFYRTRDADDMHAVVGRETAETADLDSAINVARRLSQNLAMPQSPDGMTITDAEGAILYSGSLKTGSDERRKPAIMDLRNEREGERDRLAIGVWDNEGGALGFDGLDRQIRPPNRNGSFLDRLPCLYRRPGAVGGRAITTRSFSAVTARRVENATLKFPNHSRSFDEARNAVRFIGHDGMFEVPFFVEAGALTKPGGIKLSETVCLMAFDAARGSIHDVVREACSGRRGTYYTLTAADFR